MNEAITFYNLKERIKGLDEKLRLFDGGELEMSMRLYRALTEDSPDSVASYNLAVALVQSCMLLHLTGDFGILGKHDVRVNKRAIKNGHRILSAYLVGKIPTVYGATMFLNEGKIVEELETVKVYVETSADRSLTYAYLAEEY